eukprot:3438110-Amphidinium_carterae.1
MERCSNDDVLQMQKLPQHASHVHAPKSAHHPLEVNKQPISVYIQQFVGNILQVHEEHDALKDCRCYVTTRVWIQLAAAHLYSSTKS